MPAKRVRHGMVFARKAIDRNVDAMARKECRRIGARLLAMGAFSFDRIDDRQPHLVSRTRELGAQMGQALSAADAVYVADLYLAREDPDPEVTSALVANAVSGPPARLVGSVEAAAETVLPELEPGDLVLTLGAGSITSVGPRWIALGTAVGSCTMSAALLAAGGRGAATAPITAAGRATTGVRVGCAAAAFAGPVTSSTPSMPIWRWPGIEQK